MSSRAARILLEEFWDFTLPIDPEAFARRLGLRVEPSETLGMRLGALADEKKTIFINALAAPERQRYAAARELGRFCFRLGRQQRGASLLERLGGADAEEDRDAELFAADLLMPAVAVKALIDVKGIRDAVALREHFGVTSQALHSRLQQLGYFI